MLKNNTAVIDNNQKYIHDLESIFQNPVYSSVDLSNIPLISLLTKQKSDSLCVGIKFTIKCFINSTSLLSEDKSYIIRKSEMTTRNTLSKYYDVFRIQSIKIDDKEIDYDLIAFNHSNEFILILDKHEIIPNDYLCAKNEYQYIAKLKTNDQYINKNVEIEYVYYVLDSKLRAQISENMNSASMILP
jgi:hypothetical protein